MKTTSLRILAVMAVMAALFATVSAGDLERALTTFAGYEYGGSKKVLHETRMTAVRGTDDARIRATNEQLLLAFVQSDATLDARREACMWLSNLATETSRPVLARLAGRPDFADVAQIALDAIGKRNPHPIAAPSSETGRFKAMVKAADKPLARLTEAMLGPDEQLARLALELVREGVATKEACGWLGGNIDRLSPPRQVVAMNVLLAVDAAGKNAVISKLARDGKGVARPAAIEHLGAVGRKEDAGWLMGLAAGSDEALADAARSGLLAMPDEVVRDGLLQGLQAVDPAAQATAIDLSATRGAAEATGELFRIAGEAGNPNRGAAAEALGRAAPAGEFPRLLGIFAGAEGTPVEKEFQTAVWSMARRQPSYDLAITLMREQGAKAPEKVRGALDSMAKKLMTLKPTVSLDHVNHPPPSAARPEPEP